MDTGVFAFASSSNSQTFTPIRRRESTINTRQFNADAAEKEWTTARCHRLLRALTSRVAILTKEICRYAPLGKDTIPNNSGADRVASSKVADADWVQARKRIRKTYSNRGGKADNGLQAGSKTNKGRRSFVPGEVSIPTPLLARARGEQSREPAQIVPIAIPDELAAVKTKRRRTRYTMGIPEGDFQLTKSLREIRQDVTAIRYTTYEGIYNGLEALLRATEQEEQETRRTGARSLSSMALRAVPRYVAQQEALLEAHMQETGSKSAIQSRDIATEIYDELEGFGTSGQGWHQLRAVVRSHGLEVLGDAIRAGLFDIDFCGALISLCIHTSAIDEAELLLSAMVSSAQYSKPQALYDHLSRPISMLGKFARHTGRLSFQYRQLASIVSSMSLPVEWLATKDFGSIWTEAIQALSPDSDNGDVLSFLNTSMSALSDSSISSVTRGKNSNSAGVGMVEAVRNTFSSLLTTFLSVVVLSKETEDQQQMDNPEISTQRCYYFVTLLRHSLSGYQPTSTSISSNSILPLLANLFIDHEQAEVWASDAPMGQHFLNDLEQNADDFTSISSSYSEAVMFICQVARCCGRGASSSGFEYLEHLHLILESLLSGSAGSNVLMGLIVDSAFTFAQKVPDRKHLDYAANMDAKYCSRGFNTESSLHNISVTENNDGDSGFRWEEGIGEWVTATPVVETSKRSCAMEQPSGEDSECDTPYRPPPHLRRRIERRPSPPRDSSSQGYNEDEDGHLGTHLELQRSPELHSHRSIIEISSDSEQPSDEVSPASESEDELADISMQSIDSSKLEETDDEIELSFTEESLASIQSPSLLKSTLTANHRTSIFRNPRLNRKIYHKTDDWQVFDESFASTTSSLGSNTTSESSGPRREYIDRAPRLGRKALQTSDTWQLFDESDDELSFLSVSSQDDQALQDITNTGVTNVQRPGLAKTSLTQSKSKAPGKRVAAHFTEESEDELCI